MHIPPQLSPVPVIEDRLILRRKLLKLIGAQFHIHDAMGNEVMIAQQKGFKLKEDIRVLRNGQEILGIFARQVMDFKGAYEVVDFTTAPQTRVGVFKRKGWKSMLRDEWIVCDAHEREIGTMIEDSMGLALVRRLLTNLVPQNYDLLVGETKVVDLKQGFNPFAYHLQVDFAVPASQFDRRLGLAGAILLAAIEGRQSG